MSDSTNDMVWRYMRASIGYDDDAIIDTIASECVWHACDGERESLWCIEESEWAIRWRGCIIASSETIDLQPLQLIWAIGPAWERLHLWEDWASEHAPEHLEAPRNALIAKWRWHHGEISEESLAIVRSAASAAAGFAENNACDGPLGVTNAVWNMMLDSSWAASSAVWTTMFDAALDVADCAAWAVAWGAGDSVNNVRDAEYARYRDMFTRYVIAHVMGQEGGDE